MHLTPFFQTLLFSLIFLGSNVLHPQTHSVCPQACKQFELIHISTGMNPIDNNPLLGDMDYNWNLVLYPPNALNGTVHGPGVFVTGSVLGPWYDVDGTNEPDSMRVAQYLSISNQASSVKNITGNPYRYQRCFCVCGEGQEPVPIQFQFDLLADDYAEVFLIDSEGNHYSFGQTNNGFYSPTHFDTLLALPPGRHCLFVDVRDLFGHFVGFALYGELKGKYMTTGRECCSNLSTISGIKYQDNDCNGAFDDTIDGVLANWELVLVDESTSTTVGITTTDAFGSYSFTNLPSGNYSISETLQPGWTLSHPTSNNYEVSITQGGQIIGPLNFFNCPVTTGPCYDCPASFSPEPGKPYVLSAWVKEDEGLGKTTYSSPKIILNFPILSTSLGPFKGKGQIIDGWQRIEEAFLLPAGAKKIEIILGNDGSDKVYFDDVRFFPFDANMKSFVYDPNSNRLMAELDENNYATFYEYDDEGGLIRVKKETERGVMTIQESRNATRKEN